MPEATFSVLRLIGWGGIALGGILLLSLLGRGGLRLWRRMQPLKVWARYAEESSPFRRRRTAFWRGLGTLLILLLAVLFGAAGGLVLFVEERAQDYTLFPVDEIVARVQCVPVEQPIGSMSCALALEEQEPFTVTLAGVRWGITGEVIAWDPALERLGVRSGYRLLRLEGYDAGGTIVAVHDFPVAGKGLDWLFNVLDSRLPVVRANRQVATGDVIVGTFYELTVTRAGFSLHKWESVQP
jgi:hypothetical protein